MLQSISELLHRAALATLWPVHEFLVDGKSRYFWLYVLTGMLIAGFLHWRYRREQPFARTILDRNLWMSESAINDYLLLIARPVLMLTVLTWTIVHSQTIAGHVAAMLRAVGVNGTVNDGSALGLAMLLTLTLFLVDDFLRFYLHYLFHRIPWLWEFHKVHHSAEVLNFATAERIHPFEVIAANVTIAVVVGAVNGVFIALFGDTLTVQTVAGANIFLFVFNIFGGVLRHSPYWVSFGPVVERWVISPAMHQIHHSDDPKHFDKNMGGALSVWDRMFGTLYITTKEREAITYGLGAETKEWRSFTALMFRPFVQSFAILRAKLFPGRAEAGKPVV